MRGKVLLAFLVLALVVIGEVSHVSAAPPEGHIVVDGTSADFNPQTLYYGDLVYAGGY